MNSSDDGVIPFSRFLSSLHRHGRRQRKRSNQDHVDGIPSPASGDLILLEHSLSLPSSTTTTTSSTNNAGVTSNSPPHDEEEIYRRAQVRTPTETATRERVAGGLLLRHVAEATETKRLVILQTTDTLLSSSWLKQELVSDDGTTQSKVTSVISVAHDTSGWDDDDNTNDPNDDGEVKRTTQQQQTLSPIMEQHQTISVSLDDMEALFQTLGREIQKLSLHKPSSLPVYPTNDLNGPDSTSDDDVTNEVVVVMIESILPLVMRHGWEWVMFGIQDLLTQHSFMVLWIPIWIETSTSWQLMQLEDLALAVLWMRHGDLHVLQKPRQQQGAMTLKTRRGIIPFDIHYDGERGEYEMELLQQLLPAQTIVDTTTTKSQAKDETTPHHHHHHPSPFKAPPQPLAAGSRTVKPVLRLEEDDDDRKLRQPTTNPLAPLPTTISAPSRPQIYLQDDDPEYDDLDEEDPDDDLDL